jgi:hypothetical protein
MGEGIGQLAWIFVFVGFAFWRDQPRVRECRMEVIWETVIGAFAIVMLTLELYALMTGLPTLSQMIWKWQRTYPLLPFWIAVVFGLLMMHWFNFIPG